VKNSVILLFGILFISCGSDDAASPTLTSIEIISSEDFINLNSSMSLQIEGFDQSNETITIAGMVSWSASNANVSIDQTGTITGIAVGDVVITAEIGGISDTHNISVWDSSATRMEYYVSDAGDVGNPPFQILKFDNNGSNPRVFIDQNLAWPQDILFLEDQSVVLISNLNSGNINRHEINSGRFIDSFATGIGGPTRMKIGSDGLLYVLQWTGNGRVRRYELDGTFVDQFTDTGVEQSIGLDWDSEGNLYVSSYNNGANGFVRKFDPSGKDMGLLINTGLQGPTNIWFDDSGKLMINDWTAGSIFRYDLSTSSLATVVNGLSRPEGVAILEDGSYLIGNGGTGAVKLFNSNNSFIEDFISSGSGALQTPNAVVIREVN
jgi:sugar lactone lactonase YvrE